MNPNQTSPTVSTTSTVLPSYSEIFQQIGEHLGKRKSLLFKRTLLLTWPILLTILVGTVLSKLGYFDSGTASSPTITWFYWAVAWIILVVIYSAVVSSIFEVEKRIWVDSFFDNKPLEGPQSWKMATKLFWPSIKFRILLWLRYTVPPLVALVLMVVALVVGKASTTVVVVAMAVAFIALGFYFYYLRIKLRYVWFIFLDTYGSNTYNIGVILAEMNKLNEVSKGESFKKTLVTLVGIDSASALTQIVISGITAGIMKFGTVGKVLGQMADVYSKQLAQQAASLGTIVSMYVLYRCVRKTVYGTEQVVNKVAYDLVEK